MAKKKIVKKKVSAQASKKLSTAQILADEARYLVKTYRRPPVVFTRGRGCRVYDAQGREYLDFLGGIAVNALGHAHPRLVRVIRREAGRATHISNLFHNAYQGPLARKLAQWARLDRVFFTNSGAESIEGALKLARGLRACQSRRRNCVGQAKDAFPRNGKFLPRPHLRRAFGHVSGEIP